MKKNKIIFSADTDLQDNQLREWFSILETKVDTINKRTKNTHVYIRDLERKIKKLEKKEE